MAAFDTSPDAARLLRTRGLRALVDGLVAVVLPTYLLARGLTPTQVGAVIAATLLGSAAVTLTIGLRGGLTLLAMFREIRPPEEIEATT